MAFHVRKGRIALHGTLPLYDRRNLDRILAVIEAHGFTPSTCGIDERGGSRYSRAVALNLLADPPMEFDETDVVIVRRSRRVTSRPRTCRLALGSGSTSTRSSRREPGLGCLRSRMRSRTCSNPTGAAPDSASIWTKERPPR